jgi:hypothetical protein
MNLTPIQIQFLRRLANEKPETSTTTKVAEFFSEDQRIGVRVGRRFEYSPKDHDRAVLLLVNHGLSLVSLPAGATRAQAIERPGVSEKVGTVAPHDNSVAVKCANGICRLGEESLPRTGYTVLTLEQALQVRADRIMVVENLESFRWLARASWIDYQDLNVLAIYRGDPRFKINEALRLVLARTEPVWTYFDFDPAGLAMSSALPRLERLILPTQDLLTHLIRSAEASQLFSNQLKQYEGTLDNLTSGPVQEAWRLMKSLRSGIPQEWMDTISF